MGGQPHEGVMPAVELRGVSKRFPGVVANDAVDLTLWPGEIHVLLGENGAGKSTLMRTLSGMCSCDSGEIRVRGELLASHGGPARAREMGIGMVYQAPSLVPEFDVVENLLLGTGGGFLLDRTGAMRDLRRLAGGLGVEIDPLAVTGDLPPGRRQLVEIVKVLSSGAEILILDEPTALLAPQEIAELQRVLKALRGRGLAIVLITHKLPEALALADRVTVLRSGRVAGTIAPDELATHPSAEVRARIVRMMFGDDTEELVAMREISGPETAGRRAGRRSDSTVHSNELLLRAEGLATAPSRRECGLRGVSFQVRKGEVLGIAGVEGNGQRELAEVLAGQRQPAQGRLWFDGDDITRTGVGRRQTSGIRFVTDDRGGEGTVPTLSVSLNLLLKRVGRHPFWTRWGRMRRDAVNDVARALMHDFDIRAPHPDVPCGTLSGGNLQKVVIGRELSFAPRLVIYQNPTQGLDARTTVAIRRRIRELADSEGVAAVLISNDLDELLELSHRIGVMWRGRMAGVVDNAGPSVDQRVGALMLGGPQEPGEATEGRA